jgi:hypothetical protein
MRFLAVLIFISFISRLAAQAEYREKIWFHYNSVKIPAKSLKQIKTTWDALPKDASVELIMVSDKEIKKLDPGSVVTLSRTRSEAINVFLLNQKLAKPHNIEAGMHSYIEVDPIPGTKVAFNRIVRAPYKVHSIILNKDVPICSNHTDAERTALNSKKPTVFSIDPGKANTLTGANGVLVDIPAHAFHLPPEKKSGEVIVKLWEFITANDIILAGLTTTSAGRLLETGGMIYITAENEGTCLKLRYDAKIKVRFPSYNGLLDSMRLFKGIPQKEIIDWKEIPLSNPNPLKPKKVKPDEGEPSDFDSEEDSISYYVLESAKLGWINCDKFTNEREKINVVYNCPANFNAVAGLVFTEINSFLGGDFTKEKSRNVQFYGVPKGMEARLLIYATSLDKKKVQYAMRDVILGNPIDEDIKLEEISMEEFKDKLSSIR